MTRDEFIEKHSEIAWDKLVKPIQEFYPQPFSNNANVLADNKIGMVLYILGLETSSLLEAKAEIEGFISIRHGDK